MPFFQHLDARLHYEVVENVLPSHTLFLHGNVSSNLWWEPSKKIWSSAAAGPASEPGHMVLLEWRGCGKSKEFRDFSFPLLVSDILAFTQYLNLGKLNLVGHSTGGLLSLHALAQEPQLFAKALLLDPASPEGIPMGPSRLELFLEMGRDKMFCAAAILATILGGKLSKEFRQKIVDDAFSVSPVIWSAVPEFLGSPPPLDYARIHHEILVAHGQLDAVLDIQQSEALAGKIKGKLLRLPGRGHSPNLEDPQLFTSFTKEFLSS
jgi:pimeloyl-ACP methyl ester carboxylesterase